MEHLHTLIPHTASAVTRPRLLAKLAAATEHRLTLICAPPGFGKTTLAAQYARTLDMPVVWQTIREYDRDVPHLHAQTLVALKTLAPGSKRCRPPRIRPRRNWQLASPIISRPPASSRRCMSWMMCTT